MIHLRINRSINNNNYILLLLCFSVRLYELRFKRICLSSNLIAKYDEIKQNKTNLISVT